VNRRYDTIAELAFIHPCAAPPFFRIPAPEDAIRAPTVPGKPHKRSPTITVWEI
jgi:hypothetical protein